MRIVFISDTHGKHRDLKIPDGDMLIHAGDCSMTGSVEQIASFNNWLGTLSHAYKICIAGNHDWLFERRTMRACDIMSNAIYLEDSEVVIDGIKIYGSPWQPWFCDWAFNLPRGEKLREKWRMIPADTDILITHGPPHSIMDRCPDGQQAGCKDLSRRIEIVRPKLHVFGHIHSGHGIIKHRHTTFINASMLDEMYMPGYEAIVIEYDK
jgi:Icc-related predicted phosphoesterase